MTEKPEVQEHEPFKAQRTKFTAKMAQGHRERTGHVLVGYYVPAEGTPVEWGSMRLVRSCCGEEA